MIIPLYSALVKHIWIAGSSAGFPTTRRCGHVGESPAKGQEDEATGSSSVGGQTERAGPVEPGEYKTQKDLIHVGKYWKRGSKGDGASLCLVPTDRTRGNEQKLQYRKFCLNTQPPFFCAVRVIGHWHRLPRGAAESHP